MKSVVLHRLLPALTLALAALVSAPAAAGPFSSLVVFASLELDVTPAETPERLPALA